ncbi:leucine--tRNA ligase [candidate division KSB1 bacterium 4484_87]|nr:MAG: leucine--tRNA ligase [candidate division KSB1 bacterium 4484_87]
MSTYPFTEVEKKWRQKWEETQLYKTDMNNDVDKKLYCLVMFIYPSGDKLHIGHWYNYGPTDSWARFKRMQGYNVFEPMGYDAFGLPAENYAIKHGIHPAISTAQNIEYIRQQLKAIGAMYDWSKEINTSAPEYYKWTQWFFLLLYKNGLAYRKKAPVNWCPKCQTVLANEQVIEGRCERCETEVTHRDLEQWFFKITDYAEKLLEGHNRIDWPEKTITMQKNWIGKSEGAKIIFQVDKSEDKIEVFTTRPDTLWGVTYMVLAPEHPLVAKLTTEQQREVVNNYVAQARKESDIQRTSTEKEKTGVFTGAYAINPVNNERVPIWIADYVLVTYGTGAVMAVPGHDTRDFEFATKYNLPIREVISPDGKPHEKLKEAYIDAGIMINSGEFTGTPSKEGIEKVIRYLEENKFGEKTVNYKLRDWLISRQRYWGAPIPIVYCPDCGEVPVPEDQLPVVLPEKVDFKGRGESPLKTNPDFVNTTCPKCGKPARREVDTMDTFVCSSWYYLRFPNPEIDTYPFDKDLVKKWLPVDQYVGGAEHAVMHLMYARFFAKVLYDLKLIDFDEPFKRLVHQGVITKDSNKMSKSRGNVVNPDIFVEKYGSDTFRMYMMFMGSYEDGGDWSDEGITGIHRFINRVWRLIDLLKDNKATGNETKESKELERIRHYTIKMVTNDLERFHFNTAISRIMELVNGMYLYIQNVPLEQQNRQVLEDAKETLVLLIAPFAPHFAEECWEKIGKPYSIFNARWPEYDEAKTQKDTIPIAVQVNGKLRATIEVERNAADETVLGIALADEKIQKHVGGKTIVKKIVVKNRLINFVVK